MVEQYLEVVILKVGSASSYPLSAPFFSSPYICTLYHAHTEASEYPVVWRWIFLDL